MASSSLLSGHSNPPSILKLSDRDSAGGSDSKNDPLLLSDDVADRGAVMSLPIYNKREVLPPPQQRGIYQATCDPSLIPEIAKNMKWHDPHFNIQSYTIHSNNNNSSNNNNNIIAVFDIDHNTINRYFFRGGLIYVWALIYFFPLQNAISDILPNALSSEARGVLSFTLIVIIYIGVLYLPDPFRERIMRYKNIHIAIATDGIYIDERNTNRHHRPLQYDRTIIPYEQIDKCYIHSYQVECRGYLHVTFLDKNAKKINSLFACFHHLHLFVDLVNEMTAKSSASTSTTTTVTALVDPPMVQHDTTSQNETEAASIV